MTRTTPPGETAARPETPPSGIAATPAPAPPSPARHPFHEALPDPDAPQASRATRNAGLSPAACRDELRKRGIPFERARRAAPGVFFPVQLSGPLHGVRFLAPGGQSVNGILDCRLALSLDDAAEVLARHGVAAVRVDSYYRTGTKRSRAKRKKSQHALGLAMDVLAIDLVDGRSLRVDRDWRGARGEPACGEQARLTESTPEAIALRNLVCEVARGGVFHHVLSPNYDAAHESHLHLDIQRGARRVAIH